MNETEAVCKARNRDGGGTVASIVSAWTEMGVGVSSSLFALCSSPNATSDIAEPQPPVYEHKCWNYSLCGCISSEGNAISGV